MKRSILPVCFFALFLFFPLNSWAGSPALASANWTVGAPGNLATNPPSNDSLIAFVAKVEGGLPNFVICSSKFADLRNSGSLSLVVATSDGRFCSPDIIDKTASGFDWYSFDENSQEPEVRDLSGNGKLELVVPTNFTSYYGARHCVGQWPVIYAWTGNAYMEVSNQYKSYYEHFLASLQNKIAAAEERKKQESAQNAAESTPKGSGPQWSAGAYPGPQAKPPEAPQLDEVQLPCAKAEAAKIERFLGARDTGIADAIKWAESDNPNDREFATDVLADIGTPESVEYLRTLSRDSVKSVALSAQSDITQARQGAKAHTMDLEGLADKAGNPIRH